MYLAIPRLYLLSLLPLTSLFYVFLTMQQVSCFVLLLAIYLIRGSRGKFY